MSEQLNKIEEIINDLTMSNREKIEHIHALTTTFKYEYTDSPRLEKYEDQYYGYAGCDWGIDLDKKWYWKLYDPSITTNKKYSHLKPGDYINEQARVNKYIDERLRELKIIN